ncbi:FUSC family protein [Massilia terrae]|uniref:FUSC family protein n=1 Tax=Massilia terrae TaxID=1811224 RepID=A0ABT2D1C0_9BURK|nr:FUSC family protein [Massilia terrae]
MRAPTLQEALFSVKSFAASMLAVYVSLRIGLPRPFWAMMTAYIVSAPFAGPTRSKAIYRLAGTFLGAAGAVLLVPNLVNSPELLSLGIALWVAVCLYISLLDRTPRSYVVMLAGYTCALIAFPSVDRPDTIFDTGLARVEEILLGMGCATLIHSLVLPQSFAPVLLARLDNALRDAQHWITDALSLSGDAQKDRRKLAADITELRMMSTHLPFDTSHLRWTSNAIHALQDRLATMMPLLSGIEDRLKTLRELGAEGVSLRWRAVLDDVRDWANSRRGEVDLLREHALRAQIDELTPAVGRASSWQELVEVNLALRLRALIDACVAAQALRGHIDAGVHGSLPPQARDLEPAGAAALHLDRGMALMSALGALIGVLAGCAFWIITGWPSGSVVPMFAAVMCCFFSTQDDPVPFITGFLKWTLWSVPLSALYVLGILPAVNNFESLVLVCAPTFFVLGVLLARPANFGQAMPFLFGLAGTLAMVDTRNADMITFVNSTLAQIAGIWMAALTTRLFRTVGAGFTARRLLKAGWSELAGIGRGDKVPSVSEFSARMVDRISLLTPRLQLAGKQQDLPATDALKDLRIGLNMSHLAAARGELGRSQASIAVAMADLARHFESRPQVIEANEAHLLGSLDNALRAVCEDMASVGQTQAVAALAGIRRDLFPRAAAYLPSPVLEKETQ